MNKDNNLDERQEQVLLKIEHNGFWLAFWLLLAAMLVQQIAFGPGDFRFFAGETLILFIISVYTASACVKNGIWDRKLQPRTSTNLIISLVTGAALGLVTFLAVYHKYSDMIRGCIAGGILIGAFAFVLCFILLSISAKAFKKRREIMDREPDEEEI